MPTDNLYPIPVYTQKRGYIRVEDGATRGARLGVNLYDENGDLIDPATLDAAAIVAAAIAAHRTEANAHPISSITNLQASLDSKALDSAVVHIAGTEQITGYKEFTNGEINIRGFAGDPNGGVIRWGTDTSNNYQWKTGNTFRFKAGTNAEVILDSNGGSIWTTVSLAQPMTLNTPQTVTATKTFTAQQIIDGQALRVQNWSGTAGDGVVYFGDAAADNYIYKAGNQFLFRFGTLSAVLNAGGAIWTGGNLAQPMTLNTNQTVTGTKTFSVQQTVDNCTFNFRNWAGVPTNGLVLLGDSSYIWKTGSAFQFYNAQGGFDASLNSGGTILTTVNNPGYNAVNNGGRLGTAAMFVPGNDWNNALENGWYMSSDAANAPSGPGVWYIGIVTQHNTDWVTQELWDFTAGADAPKYRRQRAGGVWGPWTPRLTLKGHLAATSRVMAMDGPLDTPPSVPVIQLLYIQAAAGDQGILSAYHYGTATYKPIRIESSNLAYAPNGGAVKVSVNFAGTARMVQVDGGISSQGASAQLETFDRTSGRAWVWYGTGDVMYLYNGSSDIMSVTPGGVLAANTLSAVNAAGAGIVGNGSGLQLNGAMYENGTTYNLAANGAAWVRNPRVFVQSGDPGAQAADGDLWFW